MTAWWVCGDSEHHYFEFGQEGWHLESFANQGFAEGQLVPNMCQAAECLDSTHLWGPMDEKTALLVADVRRYTDGLPLRNEASLAYIVTALAKLREEREGHPVLESVQQARLMAQMRKDTESWHDGLAATVELGDQFRRGLDRFL